MDDGSTDNTVTILKIYGLKDIRLKLLFPGRLGRGKALNYGLSHCKGNYVAINDADDWSKNYRLEKQINFLNNHPEIGLLGGRKEILENGNVTLSNVITDDQLLRCALTQGQPIQHSTVMFRKNILE